MGHESCRMEERSVSTQGEEPVHLGSIEHFFKSVSFTTKVPEKLLGTLRCGLGSGMLVTRGDADSLDLRRNWYCHSLRLRDLPKIPFQREQVEVEIALKEILKRALVTD